MSRTERPNTINRRQFFKLTGAVVSGLVAGWGGWRVLANETDDSFHYSREELIPLAVARLGGAAPQFGTLPDFDRANFDPWLQLDEVLHAVGQEDFVGTFATVEAFQNQTFVDGHLRKLERIAERGAHPVTALGYGRRIEGYHPFDPRVRHIRRQQARHVMDTLGALGSAQTIRLFFEMTLPIFSYGRGRDLGDAEHEQGYKDAFADFFEARQPYHNIKLSFNPAVHNHFIRHPFAGYWPVVDGQLLADSAGIDAYHLFPGRGKFDHLYYWIPGQHSPEQTLLSSFQTLDRLANNQVPWYMWELGSLSKNAGWLAHALLLTLASGGRGVMHFNYDKAYVDELHEGDWTINAAMAAAYRGVLEEVKTHQLAA